MGFLKSFIGTDVKPDLEYAAKGFMMVALTRANRPEIDLHDFELRYAHQLLSQGCTEHQALSARWGGVHAISADITMYDCAVEVAKDTSEEAGLSAKAGQDEAALYRSYCLTAATFMIRKVWETDRKEFGRFLRYTGR